VSIRRFVWTGAALAGLAAVVVLTARGQDRPVSEPKYYQGKVSPPSRPEQFPASSGRTAPTSTAPTAKPSGTPTIQYPAAGKAQPKSPTDATKPRLTQPVVAGPNGVRPAGSMEPMPVSATPPPVTVPPPPKFGGSPPGLTPPRTFDVPPAGTTAPVPLPEPTVTAEPETKLPEPKPLAVGGAGELPAPKVPELPPAPAATFPPVTPTPQPKPQVNITEQPAPAALPASLPNGAPLPSRSSPNLTVDFVAPEAVGVGQSLVYELVVRNVGTSSAMNVRVEDELPGRAAFVSSEPAAETTGGRLAWSVGTMEPGIEKRIKVTVKPAEEGELTSRAVVSFTTAVEARVKATRPRIAVAMTGPENCRVGEKVPFQIKLSNTGTGPAGRILLQAKFGDGLSHPAGAVIEAELAGLPAGQSKTLSLEAIAAKSGAQVCLLTAAADGNAAETTKATVNIVEPMLVAKQTGPAKCLVKSEPVYQIELTNPGTAATDPVQVWAALPAGFEFVAASDGGALMEANRAIGWRLPGLAEGGTKTLTLKLRATAPSEGIIRTVAQAAPAEVAPAGGVAAEVRPVGKVLEARAETAVKAEGVPALRFEVMDIEDPVELGKEAVYEIRVVNQGTGACTNVQIVADLAEGTASVGTTGPTTGRVSGQQITFEPIATLGVKAEAVYRVRVKGSVGGDQRFRVRLVCDQIRTPVVKEENTRFYKE
jgi:uncharacterized repeat protein (TIGR01451 family)